MVTGSLLLLFVIPGCAGLIVLVCLGIKAAVNKKAEEKDREALASKMDAVTSTEAASDNPYLSKKSE
jgi:hypothetical protein